MERPALALNWDHAYQFCEWVGKRLSEKYSLPTEAQWEFAARSGGKKIRYASGDPSSLELDNYMKGEYYIRNPITKAKEMVVANDPIAKPKGNAYGHFLTQYESAIDYPAVEYYRNVGSYPPNELGIYDMTGNASEWTLDWYQPKYYPIMSKDNPRGPVGPTSDVETVLGSDKRVPQKVVRDHVTGNTLPGTSESTLYIRSGSPINDYRIGFRCVKNIYSETP